MAYPIKSFESSNDHAALQFLKRRKLAIEKARENGLALKNFLSGWARDREVVSAAIKNNPLAIRFAPAFQDDEAMAQLAVKGNGLARIWLSQRLQEDQSILDLSKKTLPSAHKTYSIGSNERLFLIKLKDNPLIKYLAPLTSTTPIYPSPHFVRLENEDISSSFVRDSHVTLFEGGHLLPYPIEKLEDDLLIAMLPPSAYHFFTEKPKIHSLYGTGFNKQNVDQAMVTAYDFDIPFQRGQTCIEGGNCFLFFHKSEPRALIGEISVYLSMIALEEQGCFNELNWENIDKPSADAYRIARNIEIYEKAKEKIGEEVYRIARNIEIHEKAKEKIEEEVYRIARNIEIYEKAKEKMGEFDFLEQIKLPLSAKEELSYHLQAQKIEAKIQLTKRYISKELNLPVENITFIPQGAFHIDMEMCVTPDGEILLNDDEKVLEFLSQLKEETDLKPEEQKLFELYKKHAQKKPPSFKSVQQKRLETLKELGLIVHTLPALLKTSSKSDFKSTLNYSNGIFIKEGTYVTLEREKKKISGIWKNSYFSFLTTGPSIAEEQIFHDRILAIFEKTIPQFKFKTVPGMSEFITRLKGGIRCLTFEESLNGS